MEDKTCSGSALVFATGALLWGSLTMAATGSIDVRLERLAPEHRALALRMVGFMDRADQKYFARAQALNGGVALTGPQDTLSRETDDSIYSVRVARGPLVGKLGRMLAEGKKTQPGRR